MSSHPAEFWIDVGGTFTDCLMREPDGRLRQLKLLSSGVTKGTAEAGSSPGCIVDPARVGDPVEFWQGFQVSLLDDAGRSLATSAVSGFDAAEGRLQLDDDLSIKPGTKYELACELEAPVLAIRQLLGLPLTESVPPVRLRLGTTQGTNALLTRSGARTALAITKGFGDLLEIGSQERPRLFDLTIRKPPPLTEWSVEIDERVAADGQVLRVPELVEVRSQLEQLKAMGAESLAICLLHADLYPEHEHLVEGIAREVGFAEVSCSSKVAPLVKIVSRAETTVVDAYLNPVLRSYVAHLHQQLPGSQIRLMTSAGGLIAANSFRGHESVLSGPAGGVVGYAQAAQAAGYHKAIGFDMGGTSTDVSRFDGRYQYEFETRKAGVRLVSPTLAIDTVAAGGGSICKFDGKKLTVGPESAGAEPGPACYGRGGPLTVTDLNLWLGRIAVQRFPFALDRSAVGQRLHSLSAEVRDATQEILTSHELAEGLLKIANANMARAIRGVSIAKGVDPLDYVLVCFGGAGAQHACAVAQELAIGEVLIHPDAAILSAYGIGQANVVRHAARGVANRLADVTADELQGLFESISARPIQETHNEGFSDEQIELHRSIDLRYQGTDAALNLAFLAESDLRALFEAEHRRQFGYVHEGREIEIVALRVEAIGKTKTAEKATKKLPANYRKSSQETAMWLGGEELTGSHWDREQLEPGDAVRGPAIIAEQNSTIVVETDWRAEVLSGGEILLSSTGQSNERPDNRSASQAVMLEVFNNLFAGVAEQMGHVLRRTAGSVNVKERLDYSCAVFSEKGELIANAPHVPVHLGAMGATVRSVLTDHPRMSPGDVFVTNDPYRGGSHLPDVTVVTPVHDPQSQELLFFTACRAHHAEIGGTRPGSMPPFSTRLSEEGVLISDFMLVDHGVSQEAELEQLLSSGPYPSRNVQENLADVRAQVAANRQGSRDLLQIVEQYGLQLVQLNMQAIQEAAESKVRAALSKVKQANCSFVDYLENAQGESIPIRVAISFPEESSGPVAVIDFSGTAPVVEGNLNANRAIVTAAVMYVLRLLVDEDIPLNEGALRAVEIMLPECFLNPARSSDSEAPAVAAGNVETSQRVVDALLGALRMAGASQGTMNNVLFGTHEFGYYETICGGSGATADGPGASAVQIHMTNTRATDPEVLERRHPVRLWEFAIRRGSGGAGLHCGGNGAIRRLEFLQRTELSLITGRRGPHPPYGAAGASAGALGENLLSRADGSEQHLPGICEVELQPGDQLTILTPGGGGYG